MNTNISGSGLRVQLPEITTGTTRRTATIPCILSGSCTDGTSAPCTTNADCLRCTDDLSACTTNADCGAGVCAAAPAQPISCGYYCHCGFCNNDPQQACFDDTDCGAGQTCSAGNASSGKQEQPNACADLVCGRANPEECCATGEANCVAPTAPTGHCSLAPYIVCPSDPECAIFGAGTCILHVKPCFEHTIERTGVASPVGSYCIDDPHKGACSSNADCTTGECVADTVEPRYVALACVPKTFNSSINYGFGIPGPAALTFDAPSVLVTRVCGNGIVEIGEPCDGSDCCTVSCTFAPNDTPCADDGQLCTDDECSSGACLHPYDATNDVSCTTTTTLPSGTTTTTTALPSDTTTTTTPLPGQCIPACDSRCQRCDSGTCVGICGNPWEPDTSGTTVIDASFVLQFAVGPQRQACRLCVCDAVNDGEVKASDALAILRFATGLPVQLACPTQITTTTSSLGPTTSTTVCLGDQACGSGCYCGLDDGRCHCVGSPTTTVAQ